MSLSKDYPTQYCCNLRAGHPRVRVQIPRQIEADNILEIESTGRLRHVSLLRVEFLGKLRHVDLLGPLKWRIPEQVEV